MRSALLLSIALLTTVLAGCSDPPPSGDLSSAGSAISVAGGLTAEHVAFNNPTPDTTGTELECQQDAFPDPFPSDQKCTHPSTTVTLNFTDLPLPEGGQYRAFFFDSTGKNPVEEIGIVNVHAMATFMADELVWTNAGQPSCKGSTAEATCKKDLMFDYVVVHLDDVPVARAPLAGTGGAFEIHPALVGVSFSATYEGKKVMLDVSGLNANLTYTAWLVSTDETGAKSHDEQFTATAGANEFTAEMAINKYSDIHIHVTGTKLNVATGAIN